jgi:hypothetical protein
MKEFNKILVCFVFSTFCLYPLHSQSGFNKVVDFEGDRSNNFDGIIYYHDKIYVSGNAYIASDSLWGVTISVFDTLGNKLWEKVFLDSSKTSHLISNTPTSFHITGEGKIMIPFYVYMRNNLGFIMLDSLGKELARTEFPNDQLSIFPGDVFDYGNDIFLIGLIQRVNDFNDIYLIKTDSLGKFKWIKYYGAYGYNELFGNVLDNKDGTFTISSSTYSPTYDYEPIGTNGWIQPWIFTIDTSGNKVWEWRGSHNDPDTHGGGPCYRMKNGDWIVVSHEYKYNNQHEFWFNASLPTITMFDSLFNRRWKIIYMDNYYGQFDKIINLEFNSIRNEIVTIGQRTYDYSWDYSELEPWVLKINTDGEILLDKCDTVLSGLDHEVVHFTGGEALSPSGSIYATGRVEALGREFGWILKMTPDGCIDTLCITTPVNEPFPDTYQLSVYPNPASDFISIETQEPLTTLEVYDMTGHLVYHLYS